jgi:hypothetical protein
MKREAQSVPWSAHCELGFTSKKSLEVIAARKGSSNCV